MTIIPPVQRRFIFLTRRKGAREERTWSKTCYRLTYGRFFSGVSFDLWLLNQLEGGALDRQTNVHDDETDMDEIELVSKRRQSLCDVALDEAVDTSVSDHEEFAVAKPLACNWMA